MSELEIVKREEYKNNRKKWILIQLGVIIGFLLVSVVSYMIYDRLNRTYYIEYTECGDVEYLVQYKENDFFEEEWINGEQAYISSLVNEMVANFNYELNIGVPNVSFDYKYEVEASLIIADKETGNNYYTLEEVLIPETSKKNARTIGVSINEEVKIDYVKFNEIASNFVKTYGLKNSSSTLIVNLTVEVISQSESFEVSNENIYKLALNIPVAVETFSVFTTSSGPQCDSKILAYKNNISAKVFKIISIVTGIIGGLGVIGLIVYSQLTKNEDITYASKIKRIMNSYGSFVQRMEGVFDEEGYQRVVIKTFNEVLNIRDTLQTPILMFENKDKTLTTFIIPTDSKILYVFEIKVDNYEEIYSRSE